MRVEDFYRSLLIREAFSEVTIEGYKKVLSKFIREIKTREPTKQQVENYVAQLRKKNYSYSHIRNTVVILEKYMKRPQPIVKDILTEGEVARILGACKNSREKTIVSVLVYSGIRNKEFCSLKVEDIDLDKGLIRIFGGKGSKDRLGYLEKFPREKKQFLITALVSGRQYCGWALRKRIRTIAKRAGINCSLLTLQNLLGHSQLNTTQLYLRSFPQKIQAEYLYLVPNYI